MVGTRQSRLDLAQRFGADRNLLTREIDVLPAFLSARGCEPLIAALTDGSHPCAEFVTHRFTLEQAREAYDVARKARRHQGRAGPLGLIRHPIPLKETQP
ncbi:hypothetical protein [Pseudolysinimonas sp.]|uniref:hypothetical protein n=1 Tax=Pseudolysinimonas sp. TaxID=2680009 RepID=UPI00286A54F0|nr:hypothetical protein [Pseudolysinimonas sp.]